MDWRRWWEKNLKYVLVGVLFVATTIGVIAALMTFGWQTTDLNL